MKASELVAYAGRVVAVTYVSGEVVRGRLRRVGAERFLLSRSVIAASELWQDGRDVDLANIVAVAEEPAAFFETVVPS